MSWWYWFFLWLAVSLFMNVFFPKRVGKGWISRQCAKVYPFRLARTGRGVRDWQMTVLFFVSVPLYLFLSTHWSEDEVDPVFIALYYFILIALYLDDYLFGDDDNWRRFWEAVRNKIKWKMPLPEPVREPGARS